MLWCQCGVLVEGSDEILNLQSVKLLFKLLLLLLFFCIFVPLVGFELALAAPESSALPQSHGWLEVCGLN